MYQRKLMIKQIESTGLRLGDSCSIYPVHGRKKAFTINRHCIDLVSEEYRPSDLSMSYIELPRTGIGPFHYRLELDREEGLERFVLKTIKGHAFWLNGLAAKEAYIDRLDRLFIDENKVNFDPFDLKEILNRHFEHPVLMKQNLLESDLKILIEGETGTGKTHLASKIHEKSGRRGAFVAVNLSSFNPQLIESELFGHKRGAFTGAIKDKIGAFETAQGGTLFLDEVDSLPLDVQTKLLTFMDNNKFRPVGETRESMIQTRLIFASGRALEPMVQEGKFRKDFFFRLKSGHTVQLASLRNDAAKIAEACRFYSLKNGVTISTRLMEFYETLAWPGNLRQLFGHLDKKKVLSRTIRLDFDELDEALLTESSDLMTLGLVDKLIPIRELKEEYVKKALKACDGNVAATARKLQVTEKTIKAIIVKSS